MEQNPLTMATTLSVDDAKFIADRVCEAAPTYHDKIKVVRALLDTDFTRIFLALEEERKASAPKLEGPPPAAPRLSEVRAIQVAIWDNWITQPRKSGLRYGMTLELYWGKPDEIKLSRPSFRSQIALLPGKQLASHVRKNIMGKQRVYPVAADYQSTLQTYSKKLGENEFLGLVQTTIRTSDGDYKRGTAYHDNQFVIMKGDLATKVERATLHIGEEILDINHFSTRPYGKRPFARGIVAQARIDLCDFFPDWASNLSLDDE